MPKQVRKRRKYVGKKAQKAAGLPMALFKCQPSNNRLKQKWNALTRLPHTHTQLSDKICAADKYIYNIDKLCLFISELFTSSFTFTSNPDMFVFCLQFNVYELYLPLPKHYGKFYEASTPTLSTPIRGLPRFNHGSVPTWSIYQCVCVCLGNNSVLECLCQ